MYLYVLGINLTDVSVISVWIAMASLSGPHPAIVALTSLSGAHPAIVALTSLSVPHMHINEL